MVRLEHAKTMLILQTTSIEKIAYIVGYENLPAFSRSFLKKFGVSPSQWRIDAASCKTNASNE